MRLPLALAWLGGCSPVEGVRRGPHGGSDSSSLDTAPLADDTGGSADTRRDTADTPPDSADTADVADTGAPLCSSFQPDSGEAIDLSQALTDGTFTTLAEPGVLTICPGTWFVHLVLKADVAVVGTGAPEETVLSGGEQGTVIEVSGAETDVSVEGVTIERGRALGAEDVAIGGGLRCLRRARVEVRDAVFRQNRGEDAGAVAASENCEVLIEDTRFEDNTAADDGGAIQVSYSALDLRRVTFDGNSSGDGGAIYAISSQLDVEDSTFTGNAAYLDDEGGGALLLMSGSSADLRRTTFEGNSCGTGGAALFASGPVILEEVAFRDNAGTIGGAIYLYGGVALEATASDFSGNDPEDLYAKQGYGAGQSYTWGEDASFLCTGGSCAAK